MIRGSSASGCGALAWLGAAGFTVFAAVWLFFATGLPTSETLLAYQPPLPSNVRGYDGNPVQTFARERRVELAYDEYPPLVVNAFISAEDKTFFSHGGIDYPGLVGAVFDYAAKVGSGDARKGRLDHHPAGRQGSAQDSSYAIGRKIREAILAFRLERVLTKEQILELYLNQIFLGRNAYGVQAAARAYFDKDVGDLTLPEAAYLAVLPKAPSNYAPSGRPLARSAGATMSSGKWRATASSPQSSAPRPRPLRSARSATAATPSSARMGGYFMEEVRRQLIKKFGENAEDGPNSVYAGGLWVRSSMIPVMQDAAAEALREGLAKFDGGRGWRDTDLSIDVDGDWRAQLSLAALGTGFPDWRKAVVLSKSGGVARIGFSDGSTGTLSASAASQPKRGGGGAAFGYLKPGMIIIVKQMGLDSYALRSIPEVSGGMVAEEVRTGRVLAMQGGFDSIGASYNRAVQALRQPGSAFKPIVYRGRARKRHDAGVDHRRCAILRVAGGRPRQQMLPQFRRPIFRRQDDALGGRAIAQFDDRPRRIADRNEQGHRQCQDSSAWANMSLICRSRSAPATRRCST